jgi:hypothetical protein
MITDYELLLSNDQAITATVASTNNVDLKAVKDVAAGEPIQVGARVTEAFNNLTSLDVAIEGCDDAAGTNPVTLATKNFLLAALSTINRALPMPPIPAGGTAKKFLRGKYTVNGTAPTVGKVRLWLAPGLDNKPANKAVTF